MHIQRISDSIDERLAQIRRITRISGIRQASAQRVSDVIDERLAQIRRITRVKGERRA